MSLWRFYPGLRPGDAAPDFECLDEEGRPHRLDWYRGRWLLLFFYPRDNTPVCVRQACAFNDSFDDFQTLGCDVLGCSGQDAGSHRRFRQACRLRYRLLSDPGRVLREAWKVPHFLRLIDGRCSFLIDPQGIVRWVYHKIGKPEQHSARALAFLKEHA
jgi:peroxiredoxin Q/BCP